jgi:hypothetical protein
MARRRKPKSPEQIALEAAQKRAAEREAEKNPATFGVNEKAMSEAQNDAVATIRNKRGKVIHAYRSDVFDLLMSRNGLSVCEHEAARKLQADIATRAGLNAPEVNLVVIDSSGSREVVTTRMLDAGRRVDAVLLYCGYETARLLRALIEPTAIQGLVIVWRSVVKTTTGIEESHAQAALVQIACRNLMHAYRTFEDQEIRRSA